MPPPSSPLVVLDTNVVLDWLVFEDAPSAPLHRAIERGALRWIATSAMREELRSVLARGSLSAWRPDLRRIWDSWDAHCVPWTAPVPAHPAGSAWTCSDSDDQQFIDLAAAAAARWLISRDLAVLRLAAPMRAAHRVEVLSPTAWIARHGG